MGRIEERGLLSGGLVVNGEYIFICEGIKNTHIYSTRKSFFPVGTQIGQLQGTTIGHGLRAYFSYFSIEPFESTVQMMIAMIGGDLNVFPSFEIFLDEYDWHNAHRPNVGIVCQIIG